MATDFPLPPNLPVPSDDGAASHLRGSRMPRVALPSTRQRSVDLSALDTPRAVIYAYPMTGVPGQALPDGWDMIPGARGCTPQTCGFRDHFEELTRLGAAVFGLSTQSTEYQQEMATRLALPFEILSDAGFKLTDALRLPTFEVEGMRLLKRLTLILRAPQRERGETAASIEQVFYPVFPPNESAAEVLRWLREHPLIG